MTNHVLPYLNTGDSELDFAFRIALGDIVGNIIPFKDGLLEESRPVILAGIDYSTPWTRDSAINTWNGGGLLFPEITKDTLISVLKNDNKTLTGGQYLIGGQYWDAIIWVIGAWYQYLYTGDKEFLELAYQASQNSLEFFENTEFDEELNLFRGAACYGDGVGAYPDIYTNANGHSTITNWVVVNKSLAAKKGFGLPMYSLSTNCLYYYAYTLTELMAQELGKSFCYKVKAGMLKEAINRHFWDESRGMYIYLIDPFGNCSNQEGMGHSFAVLFDVADEEKKEKIFKNTYVSPHGIPCLWPIFERYKRVGETAFGQHSGSVWPHIQGFWADAAVKCGKMDIFLHEIKSLAKKVCRDKHFAEYYSPFNGEIENGYQEGWYMYPIYEIHKWTPASRQTWSATAYIRMVLMGLFGMEFKPHGVEFKPYIPWHVSGASLINVRYRDMLLNIDIKGSGSTVKSFEINGSKEYSNTISSSGKGEKNIKIEMAD